MLRLFYYLIYLSILLILSNCSTLDFYNIEADSNEFDYYKGKQILMDQNNNATVYLNYEYQDGEYFVFYTYIQNNGDSKLIVTPSSFSMKTNSSAIINALDPEKEISQLIETRRNLDENHTTATGLNCLFGSFDVITSIAQGDGEEAVEDVVFWSENIAIENEEYEIETNRLVEAKQFWQNETLRITALYPDDEVGGLVYFSIDPTANSFTINFDVGEKVLKYNFKQIIQ